MARISKFDVRCAITDKGFNVIDSSHDVTVFGMILPNLDIFWSNSSGRELSQFISHESNYWQLIVNWKKFIRNIRELQKSLPAQNHERRLKVAHWLLSRVFNDIDYRNKIHLFGVKKKAIFMWKQTKHPTMKKPDDDTISTDTLHNWFRENLASHRRCRSWTLARHIQTDKFSECSRLGHLTSTSYDRSKKQLFTFSAVWLSDRKTNRRWATLVNIILKTYSSLQEHRIPQSGLFLSIFCMNNRINASLIKFGRIDSDIMQWCSENCPATEPWGVDHTLSGHGTVPLEFFLRSPTGYPQHCKRMSILIIQNQIRHRLININILVYLHIDVTIILCLVLK